MNEPAGRVSVSCRIARSAVQIIRPDKQGGKGRQNMASTDEHGSKSPQPQIKKKDFSRMIREYRMQQKSCKHCDMCGYRVRGLNHESGRHHQSAPKVIEANRIAAMA